MSKPINKESGKKSDCINVDSEDDEGYVTIHYEQPNIPALEIPTENNGDLSWNIIQALDSKIISLTILSNEKRRVLKLVNGIIKEPKGGWKSCKVFALVEKNADANNQEAIRSTTSSQLSSTPTKNDDPPVLSNADNVASSIIAYPTNVSVPLSNPNSTTSLLPKIARLVNDGLDKENSIPVNSSSIHDPSMTTEDWSNFDDLCAAYKVKSLPELKDFAQKQSGITSKFFDILCRFLRKALIKHADEEVFSLLNGAEKSNILYNRINPADSAHKNSNVCEMCEQHLTIGHLLTKDHLKKYYLKFHQEIPEIDVIVHDQIFLNFLDDKLNRPPGLSASMRCIAQLYNFASNEKNSVSQNFTSVHSTVADDNICNPAEEPDENIVEEAIHSTAPSHCDVSGVSKIRRENVQAKDFAYSTNVSASILSNSNPTSLLPELSFLAKPVICTSNKENSIPEISSSKIEEENVPAEDLVNSANLITTKDLSIFDEFCAAFKCASNEENSVSQNSTSVHSTVADNTTLADDNICNPTEEPAEKVAEEAICSAASSTRCDVSGVLKIEEENVPAEDLVNSANFFPELCNPSPTTSEPACLVTDAFDQESSIPENSLSVNDSSITTNLNFDELCAAYNVKSLHELKALVMKQTEITSNFFDILCRYLRKALIKHIDKNVFSLLCIAKNSNIFCQQLVRTASYVCELCEQPLTVGHLLQEKHLKEYYLKFNQEIPEIDVILHHFNFISMLKKSKIPPATHCIAKPINGASSKQNSVPENSSSILSVADKDVNKEFKVPPIFSTNTHSSRDLFKKFKDAFICRLRQENLTILSEDPFFLDKFMFIRDKFVSLLKLMKFDRSGCLPCSKTYGAHQNFIGHIMSVNHVRNGMSQEDLDCFCNLLSFVRKNKNGYRVVIPSSNKSKSDIGMEAVTLANVFAKLCNPNSTTSLLPKIACLVNDAIDKENSIPVNSFSIHDPSMTTEDLSIFNELCAAYNVKSLHELKALVMKQTEITSEFFDILCRFLRKALIKHADKNIFSILTTAEKSNIIWYKELDPTAPDVCELCQKPLTVSHLLKKEHLKEYELKFNQEIPEVDTIVHCIYSNTSDEKLKVPPGFSTNTQSNQQLFDEYKDAFIHRISQENLIMHFENPLFLDRFLFMRENLKYDIIPKYLKRYRLNCICEKSVNTLQNIICHLLSIDHVRNALTQEDLHWYCELLTFIQNDENGYKILLPLRKRKSFRRKAKKRKAVAGGTNKDTVPKKKSKNI